MYNNLRKIRNKDKDILETIVNMLGITKATYYRKEVGDIKFSLEEAKIIADIFNSTIDEIFFGKLVT